MLSTILGPPAILERGGGGGGGGRLCPRRRASARGIRWAQGCAGCRHQQFPWTIVNIALRKKKLFQSRGEKERSKNGGSEAMGRHYLGVLVCALLLDGAPRSIPASWDLQMGWHRSPHGWGSPVDAGISVPGDICWRGWAMGNKARQRSWRGVRLPKTAAVPRSPKKEALPLPCAMGASQTHLRRVISWGCTPHPP